MGPGARPALGEDRSKRRRHHPHGVGIGPVSPATLRKGRRGGAPPRGRWRDAPRRGTGGAGLGASAGPTTRLSGAGAATFSKDPGRSALLRGTRAGAEARARRGVSGGGSPLGGRGGSAPSPPASRSDAVRSARVCARVEASPERAAPRPPGRGGRGPSRTGRGSGRAVGAGREGGTGPERAQGWRAVGTGGAAGAGTGRERAAEFAGPLRRLPRGGPAKGAPAASGPL